MSLQGTLKTLGITEVLEFLAHREATGQLDVTTDLGEATYLFSEGRVAQSEYSFLRESGGDAAEATYYVVSELDGAFFFDEEQEPIDIDSCEDVSSILGRTADIAEKWLEVEQTIPTSDDVLIRNDKLDGSVTIQPEWWKALEVIGDGKTPLDVAARLEMGVLDASMLMLAMTNAGLLNVARIEENSVSPAPDSVEVAPMQTEAVPLAHIEEPAPAPLSEDVLVADTMMVEPLSLVPDVEPVVEFVEPAPIPEPVVEFVEPAPIPEPVVEFVEPAPIPEPVVAMAPAVDENDGWASNHSPAFDAAPVAQVAPMQTAPPLPDFTSPPPAETIAPVAPSYAPLPAAAHEPTEVFGALPIEASQDPAFDPNAQSTAMAGEVLSDLATLGELDAQPAEANWQLDGTFVADAAPTTPQVDADPFGDLGELLSDSEGEDRSSVLKFLRRD